MELETLHDVITWSRDLHAHLGHCLRESEANQEDEHARMLMTYLAEQEQKIAEIIEEFHQEADPNMLEGWCLEQVPKKHLTARTDCETPYARMGPDDITAQVMKQHEEVIDLLEHLEGHIEGETRSALVESLLQLERQETMRMSQSANRWSDI